MIPAECKVCNRNLMIWDVTHFFCREKNGIGEVEICNNCLPKNKIKIDNSFELSFVDKNAETPKPKYNPFAVDDSPRPIMKQQSFGFTKPEPGSQVRYDKRKSEHPWLKHTAWWFVHNCVSHVLIGVLPLKPFFDFHDWTSRKMHGL